MNPEHPSWHLAETSPSFLLAEEAAYWILTKRGQDVLLLDLRGKSDVCDFFLICTGQADVQVKAIARAVRDGLARGGLTSLHTEGLSGAKWALLDYVDLVIHVFQPATRQYYLLERLWSDAPALEIADAYFATEAVRRRHPDLPALASPSEANEPEV